jgi:hypothetical protein
VRSAGEAFVYDAVMADGQRTLRRLEPLHVVFAAVWFSGMVIGVIANWSEGPWVVLSLLAWAADGVVLLYLTTLAASIAVTPSSVLINNPYVQHIVPRHLVQGVRTEGYWTARLVIDNAPPVRLVALNLNLPKGYESYPSRRQAQIVMRLIAEVQPAVSTGMMRRRLRYGHLALAAMAICIGAAATACLLTTGG